MSDTAPELIVGEALKEQERMLGDLFHIEMQRFNADQKFWNARKQMLEGSPYVNMSGAELTQKATDIRNTLSDEKAEVGGMYAHEITEGLLDIGADLMADRIMTIRRMTEMIDVENPSAGKEIMTSEMDKNQFTADFLFKGLGVAPADITRVVKDKVQALTQIESLKPQAQEVPIKRVPTA